jgi:DNA polymerase III epsilon subunit-like protein
MAVYLDTETTGLSPRNGDTIVEVAIVDERGVSLIDTLVDPQLLAPTEN